MFKKNCRSNTVIILIKWNTVIILIKEVNDHTSITLDENLSLKERERMRQERVRERERETNIV